MIRNNVRETCERLGLNINNACDVTNLARSVFGRLYRNETSNISFDTLDAICKGLDAYAKERGIGRITLDDIIKYIVDEEATAEDLANVKERNEKTSHISKRRKT